MGYTIWLIGLPSSGKTTIADELQHYIGGIRLDGDKFRKHISYDLGFSKEDREAHLLRVAGTCKMLNDAGHNVIASFITPYREIQEKVKGIIGRDNFILVWVDCSIEECRKRDGKGLWTKADTGEIADFTGVSAPFEKPLDDGSTIIILVHTHLWDLDYCVRYILNRLEDEGYYKPKATMFIGRYSPPHKGHKYLFDSVLNNGGNVVIAVRDTPKSNSDPYTAEERKMMLEKLYENNPQVKVIIIPDIDTVAVGRGVGYKLMDVPEDIRIISGTKTRAGEFDNIPEEIRDLVKKYKRVQRK